MLALVSYAGARGAGPVPPLGPLLDPVSGVWAHARPADHGGQVSLPGLAAPVEVRFDRRGVPHIFARTEEDAYRALGYVVARDRLFQMQVQTLAASGRTTEIGGEPLLPLDREMRRIGIPRAAERKWNALRDDGTGTGRIVSAYADGVNAYIATLRPARYPIEFRLLGARPERWRPEYSILLLERMGWTLAYLAPETERAAAATRVGPAAAAALFPEHSPIQQPIQPNGDPDPRFDFHPLPPPGMPDTSAAMFTSAVRGFMPSRAALLASGYPAGESSMLASNNWAVAPSRSTTGHALLAGDPHLDLSLPSIWYEAHLVVPGKLDVYGVTIPGAPAIVLGFNRDVAWSFTNTGADVLDFYRETVDDTLHPARHLVDGRWLPIEHVVYRYRGKRGETVATDTLYFSERGPMRHVRGGWLSMRWTVLEPSDELAGLVGMSHARSAAEVEDVMTRYFRAPAQNVIAADRRGHIAIRSIGRYPIRPGDGLGYAIRDGSTSASDWRGDAPPREYPQALDPAQGYLASANQDPVDPRVSRLYLGVIADPWRAMRIDRLLREHPRVSPDDMRRFQTDPGSERVRFFMPYFLRAAHAVAARADTGVDRAKLAEAARLLAQWDGRYTRDNTRAVLFEGAMRELVNRTWDELEDTTSAGHGRRTVTPGGAILAELCADSTSRWWDDRHTPRIETRDDILAASLAAALDSVRARYGPPDGGGWRWSRIRHANIYHLLRIPAFSALNLSVQGGPWTLAPSAGDGTHGPSWRMVVDLGPEVRAWGIYPGGQSGDPASPRYRDQLASWLAGALDPLYFPRSSRDMDAGSTAATLTLVPSR